MPYVAVADADAAVPSRKFLTSDLCLHCLLRDGDGERRWRRRRRTMLRISFLRWFSTSSGGGMHSSSSYSRPPQAPRSVSDHCRMQFMCALAQTGSLYPVAVAAKLAAAAAEEGKPRRVPKVYAMQNVAAARRRRRREQDMDINRISASAGPSAEAAAARADDVQARPYILSLSGERQSRH